MVNCQFNLDIICHYVAAHAKLLRYIVFISLFLKKLKIKTALPHHFLEKIARETNTNFLLP